MGGITRSVLSGEMANIPIISAEKGMETTKKRLHFVTSETKWASERSLRDGHPENFPVCPSRMRCKSTRSDLGTIGREVRGVFCASCGELSDSSGIRQDCLVIVDGQQRRTAQHGESSSLSEQDNGGAVFWSDQPKKVHRC